MDQLINRLLEKVTEDAAFTLIDVGAMGGIESEWKRVEKHLMVLGFEPDEREYVKLSSALLAKSRYFNYALYNASEDLKLYVSQETSKTSLFKPNFDQLRNFPRSERFEVISDAVIAARKVNTLDKILSAEQYLNADFLKIDTQGSELAILQGASSILESDILGLKVEVEFLEMYSGQPLFAGVDVYLRSMGFQLMDLRRAYWKRNDYADSVGKGQLIFGDALYFKSWDAFAKSLIGRDRKYSETKVIKLVAMCLIYGMHDYAVYSLNQAYQQGYIDENLYAQVVQAIKSPVSRLQRLLYYGFINLRSTLRLLKRGFLLDSLYWSDGDEFLGNPR